MNTILRHKLFSYLAKAAIGIGSPSAITLSDLSVIPETMFEELLHDIHDDGWKEQDILHLAQILAEDHRGEVRCLVPGLLESLHDQSTFDQTEELLKKLATDDDQTVKNAVEQCLTRRLRKANGLNQARIIAEWTLSENVGVRLIISQVLATGLHALGADTAIEYLGDDPIPEIRATVVECAIRHFEENPISYAETLNHLTYDHEFRVREAAQFALSIKQVNIN